MLPKEKRGAFIEKPESLFGNQYQSFLKFAKSTPKNIERILKLKEDVFTPELNYELEHHLDNFKTYSAIIEDSAKVSLRNRLPYPFNKIKEEYVEDIKQNRFYDGVAKNIKDGILKSFGEIVSNYNLPKHYKKYEEKIALLLGLTALEILFCPNKDDYRFLHSIENPVRNNYWNRNISLTSSLYKVS